MDRITEELNDKQEWDESMTRCPVCGKEFLVMCRSDYVYKIRSHKNKISYFCSYSCFNKGKDEICKDRKYRIQYGLWGVTSVV